jgi:hypothetical protein
MARALTDIRSLARSHTNTAIRTLVGIAQEGTNESARVAAAVALLDRGWGRPAQAVTVDGEASIKVIIRHILEGPDGEAMDAEPPPLIEHDEQPLGIGRKRKREDGD